jgi:hypothetical protein
VAGVQRGSGRGRGRKVGAGIVSCIVVEWVRSRLS